MSENLLGRWHAKRVKNLDTYCPAFMHMDTEYGDTHKLYIYG